MHVPSVAWRASSLPPASSSGKSVPQSPIGSARIRLLRDGRLRAILPGIYVAATARSSHRCCSAQAVMLRHPPAVLTHELAAMLTFWPELQSPVVRVSGVRTRVQADGLSFDRREHPRRTSPVSSGRLRVTLPALTALDLSVSTIGPSAIDRCAAHVAFRCVCPDLWNALRGMPTSQREHRSAPACPRLPRRALVGGGADARTGSSRDANLRGWVGNHPLDIRGHRYYVDIAFRRERLAVEIDGQLHDDGAIGSRADETFESDRIRQNALVIAGWDVLRFTWTRLVDEAVKRWSRRSSRALARSRRSRGGLRPLRTCHSHHIRAAEGPHPSNERHVSSGSACGTRPVSWRSS